MNLLSSWVDCINNTMLDDLINLYDNNSCLISTFEGIIKNDNKGIKTYFKNLIDNTTIDVIEYNSDIIDNKISIEYGLYIFNTAEKKIRARFTMISKDKHIIHHHSSIFKNEK